MRRNAAGQFSQPNVLCTALRTDRESEVVVGAEVEQRLAVSGDVNHRCLSADDHAFRLPRPSVSHRLQLAGDQRTQCRPSRARRSELTGAE